jgi:hypothetical protein
MVHGPAEGLALLESLDERLPGNYRLDTVRAHLFEMAGDEQAAVQHYRAGQPYRQRPRAALPEPSGRPPQRKARHVEFGAVTTRPVHRPKSLFLN